ncbi:MAG: glycerol-3-phosphate acyltransferase [Chloroflexota bacterium]|nr:glycerol-3-phosphate acyltransferase [Chloroflexota bacterium]
MKEAMQFLSILFPLSSFFSLLSAILVSYLLGSIPSGVIVSRFLQRDVREVGSGHTGALNTFRAAGFLPAAFTFLADAGKVVLALEFARAATGSEWGVALAAVAAVIGHCLPIYTRFRGGMGLTVAGTALFLLDGPILIALVLVWFPLRYILKRSPRATMVVALLLPVLLALARAPASILAFGLGAGAVVFVRHLRDWNR